MQGPRVDSGLNKLALKDVLGKIEKIEYKLITR